MEDQVRVLKESLIDCCNYINSNLNHEERVKRLVDFRYGETMFLFVSPERFVMEDFRDIIKNIDASLFGLAFAFCVIDEVHCVSEWGHDFRTTYLMLGKNAQHFSKTRSGNPVTLVGLTATASFDVLADIERELQIQHEDVSNAIIMIENTIRPELFFRVIDVEETQRMQKLNEDFSNMGNNLQKLNNLELLERSIQDHKDNFEDTEIGAEKYLIKNEEGEVIHLSDCTQNDFYSIIFCPVKGQGGHAHGVDRVYQNLNSASKGYFYSSDTDDINQEVQKHFENFVTGSTKHIVCTKAFGMGIDKKNIRSTYHFVYSGSLESLVQEAGRAGRDKKIAEANILVSNEKYFIFDVYSLFSDNIDNGLFHNQCTRKSIRQAFERRWNEANNIFESVIFNTQQEILDAIEIIDFSLLNRYGRRYNILPPENIDRLKTIMKNQDGNHYKYVSEKRLDRGIHDFFHQQSFKGVDTERSQFLNLFKVKEFQLINNEPVYLEQQDTLANTFENCTEDKFDFIITERKTYTTPTEIICGILEINPNDTPPFFPNTNTYYIDRTLTFSHDFNDFLLTLDENNVTTYLNLSNLQKERLLFVYSRDREQNDTGKLIYRMHSMGFLIDYRIDYITKLYNCKFKKFNDITNYVQNIEKYLRRYLSENTALQNIEELKKRLTKDTLIDNIIECLYFLSEFSYKEIANKRKRATDEVESVMNTSITNPDYVADWYKQNHFIKEQIYFYFNAKYARIGFKISGIPYSLLDDYQGKELDRAEILNKYLDVFQLDGTEQNNYKHMMGSCKKILRSLGETDLNSEWLLRLLKAFAMYSVNNPSYTSEANEELEEGFDNLYNDKQLHQNNFDIIEPIFENYFNKLQTNIQENNTSFKNIKLIRIKLLQKMQTAEIEKLTNKYQQIKGKIYA
jgi:ATP-dependent DNA helicase RecQ